MIGKLFGWLIAPWTLRIVGAVLLALLIWFGGPLLAIADFHPLDAAWARIALAALLLLVWFGRLAWAAWRVRRANAALVAALVQAPATDNPALAGQAQAQQMRERFEQAMALLKSARFAAGTVPAAGRWRPGAARSLVYQLPWFLIIGAPGSGKTTALKHSGLRFPLSDKLGTDPLHGVGGTRHCDWWFTDAAVLIDTAGRYTTQDSDTATDAGEWSQFMAMLKRFRPRQPINGVLVTVSAADLLAASDIAWRQQAASVQRRIAELQQELGQRFPVYLMVTKTDLVAGFAEFFDELDRTQREQVWGVTFEADALKGPSGTPPPVAAELDRLQQQLLDWLLPRLHRGRDAASRARVQAFPAQWAMLAATIKPFCDQAFAGSALTAPVWLRGLYFTSGTQEGSPIDRLLGSLARSFAVEPQLLAAQRPGGKAFFVTRLLREVIFAESGLAGTRLAVERRTRRLKWVGVAATLALTAAAAGLWVTSYLRNDAYLQAVERQVAAFAGAQAGRPVAADDAAALLDLLDRTQAMARTADVDPAAPPLPMGWGLFQGDKLQSAANQAYRRLSTDALAPFLSRRIEAGMTRYGNNAQLQYESLKAYLMLHQREHLEPAALRGWIAFDLQANLATRLDADQRERLLGHVDRLLASSAPVAATGLDRAQVDLVRRNQLQSPFPQRVYNRLMRQGFGGAAREFRIGDAGGAQSQLVFTRASGLPLNQGVPAEYTYDGYHKGFNRSLDAVLAQLASEESWVLGVTNSDNQRRAADPRTRASLADEVRRLYLQDYAGTWEKLVADIVLVKAGSPAQGIELARLLSGTDSPLPRLLRAIVREVTLLERDDPAKATAKGVADLAADAVRDSRDTLTRMLGTAAGSPQPDANTRRVEAIVDDRFDALRRFVRSPAPNQPSPMDAAVTTLADLYTLMVATDTAIRSGASPPSGDALVKVKADAARAPEPVRSMVDGLTASFAGQAAAGTRGSLSQLLAASVGEFCQKAIAGRYPLVRGAANDARPADFGALFAQGGLMDEFFQKHLANLVDTSGRPWKFRRIADAPIGDGSSALAQFQRAEEIRRVFLAGGARTPVLRLEIKPVEMDAAIQQLTLDIDGQSIKAAAGGSASTPVQWPGPRGANQIRLTVAGTSGAESSLQFDGPWAIFRMIDAAQLQPTSAPERMRASYTIDGKRLVLEIVTSSVQNPFRLAELGAFQCPGRL